MVWLEIWTVEPILYKSRTKLSHQFNYKLDHLVFRIFPVLDSFACSDRRGKQSECSDYSWPIGGRAYMKTREERGKFILVQVCIDVKYKYAALKNT